MLLALLYPTFRLVLDAFVDLHQRDTRVRLVLLVLRHQLPILERQVRRPRWRPADRLLACRAQRTAASHDLALLPRQPQTLLRWHRDLVRRRRALLVLRTKLGRPDLVAERREILLRLARESTR